MDNKPTQWRNPTLRILAHILFWIAYVTFTYFQQSYDATNAVFRKMMTSMVITLPVDIAATYFMAYYLLPKMLFRKRYLAFSLAFFISSAILVLVQRANVHYIVIPKIYPEFQDGSRFLEFNFLSTFMHIYMVVGAFLAVKLLKTWYENQNREIELQHKNLDSELAMLRNQVNPHFLFNTLNNIDTLIKTDTEKASEYLIKLSEIMRYMIYDSNSKLVPLTKEISYLSSYIELQRIRLNDPAAIDFQVTGELTGKMIAPVLLVPPIENAFKHGYKKNGKGGIRITLDTGEDYLQLSVKNRIKTNGRQQKDEASGVGLVNLRRRLDLLYHDDYVLDISEEPDLFVVTLKIPLNED